MSDSKAQLFDEHGEIVDEQADSLTKVSSTTRTRSKAAASMAIAGATDKEIAEQLNFVSPTAARRAWEAEIAGAYDPTTDYEAMRRLTSARYEALLKSLAPKALNAKLRVRDLDSDDENATILVANEEHLNYASQYRATLDRIATLHGLNAPQVIKMQSPSQQEFERTVAALVQASGESDDGEGDIFTELEEDEDGVFKEIESGKNA